MFSLRWIPVGHSRPHTWLKRGELLLGALPVLFIAKNPSVWHFCQCGTQLSLCLSSGIVSPTILFPPKIQDVQSRFGLLAVREE